MGPGGPVPPGPPGFSSPDGEILETAIKNGANFSREHMMNNDVADFDI